ncbi:MAG: peptidoglycan DD-metalloendopeptidase family protein [Streptosporangiales bacterium]|nr:peptidoglycan DD-metalloendopeptidase family protein [Streptosporangiales bacterium]
MKRPERPETLFAVLVAIAALLLSGGTAQAATTANGSAVSANSKTAQRAEAEKKAAKDDADPASIRAQLKRLAEEHEKSEDRLDALSHRQAKVGRQVRETKQRLTASRDRVAQTARLAYTSGPANDPMVALASNDDPGVVAQRMTTLSLLSKSDNIAIKDATTQAKKLGKQQRSLNKAKKDAAAEKAGLAKKRKKLNAKLLEAAKALAARKNGQADRAKMSGEGACPVGEPVQISDTWGSARSGGRAHEGTDMLAPTGTPTYALENGTISEAGYDGLGGTIVILKGESGDSYYYAHHDSNVVSTGERVVAGQQVGRVGMSGNAQGTVPHLHFEHWPGGGNPVNPFPLVQGLCG